jgi:hypothetical protein
MTYAVAIGIVVCGWAMLSVLGGERERRLRELEAELPPRPADPPVPPPAQSRHR